MAPSHVLSQSYTPGTFSVSPAHRSITIKPGETKNFNIRITNNIGKTANFLLGAEDISPDSSGEVELLGNLSGPFSLKDFIKAPVGHIVLDNGKSEEVTITISIPNNIYLPGLYAALTISRDSDSGTNVTSGGAQLTSRIAVPIIVLTDESAQVFGRLVSFGPANGAKFFNRAPVTFNLSYENTGDVYAAATGIIRLKNIFGIVVSEIPVKPIIILPHSTRSVTINLGSKYSVGLYKANLTISEGRGENIEIRDARFVIFPWKIFLIIITLIITGAILIRRRS